MASDDKSILCVGLVCVDIVCAVDAFPEEDADLRCNEQYWQKGGNAANSASVLALLGAKTEFMGTIAESLEKGFLMGEFSRYGIQSERCVIKDGCSCPMSIVIANHSNGSRTILHARKNLPELTFDEFQKVNLFDNKYSWIHYEGRHNCSDIAQMIGHVMNTNKSLPERDQITVSVELEKVNPYLMTLLPLAHYIFISKDFAISQGYKDKETAVEGLSSHGKEGCTMICGWGDMGSIARTYDGQIFTAPIFPPKRLIDTVGAGDTFIAAVIFALNKGYHVQQAIIFGNKVAGAKCGIMGYDELSGMENKLEQA